MGADVQIAGSIGPAPQSYSVPNATEIIPKAVTAVFDGSGAGSTFVPTIEIVSDGGVVVARVPANSTVLAGGSAEVTFGNFLTRTATSTSGGITQITSTDGSITVTNPFGPVTDLSGSPSPTSAEQAQSGVTTIGSGVSAFLPWAHLAGSALLNYGTPTAPTVVTTGTYAFSGRVRSTTVINAARLIHCGLILTTGGTGAIFESTFTAPTGGLEAVMPFAGTFVMAVTDTIQVQVFNQDTAAQDFFLSNMWIQRVR